MQDEQSVNTEGSENIFGDGEQPDPQVSYVPPGEPVNTRNVTPPKRNWAGAGYALMACMILAAAALGVVLYNDDLKALIDDGATVVDSLVQEPAPVPALAPVNDTNASKLEIVLVGIDASSCDLSKIVFKDGKIGVDRDCLDYVYDLVPQEATPQSP